MHLVTILAGLSQVELWPLRMVPVLSYLWPVTFTWAECLTGWLCHHGPFPKGNHMWLDGWLGILYPVTYPCTNACRSLCYFHSILIKVVMCWQILVKLMCLKFHENIFIGSWVVIYKHKEIPMFIGTFFTTFNVNTPKIILEIKYMIRER